MPNSAGFVRLMIATFLDPGMGKQLYWMLPLLLLLLLEATYTYTRALDNTRVSKSRLMYQHANRLIFYVLSLHRASLFFVLEAIAFTLAHFRTIYWDKRYPLSFLKNL